MKYADVILPIAGEAYTFSVGAELEDILAPGCAVSVQFGARKIVGGIVRRVHDETPPYKKIKPVLSLLFPEPIVSPEQMKLWEWMAEYYMCSVGEVMRAAMPAMLKPSGFTAEEFAADEFKARRVRFVGLAPALSDDGEFNEACEKLRRRAPKQYDALVEVGSHGGVPVPREKLRADGTALAALHKKGLIVVEEREETNRNYELRITSEANNHRPEPAGQPQAGAEKRREVITNLTLPALSPAQQAALEALRMVLQRGNNKSLSAFRPALLFGVPSSGKSEVCFHAIAGTLARGRDVLLLLPEISLTTQFVGRVRRIFGDRVVLYHSGLSDRRRAEAYIRLVHSEGGNDHGESTGMPRSDRSSGSVSEGYGSLVVGTRSAVFLPMPRLGLVVVDEEQDPSYKQHDPAPRYNARDTAIVLAQLHDARVILASATPSLETWANAVGGKYGMVELSERWGGTLPPEVVISDTIRAAKRGERRSHFNKELLDRIKGALGRGEQVILFQNRRGIAPFVECTDCGWVPKCDHCGIPMTVHRSEVRCHYCGAAAPMPSLCPKCGSMNLTVRGFGTEKIEEELARLFPEARVARLDRDSATSEAAYRRIIGDFEHGATDILVGTQMVTKGLDFAGVSLVGVLNADNLVNHPDFRASERAYSLVAQVAGRAGRRQARGEVVIQTAAPESRLIAQAAAGDYRAMAADLLAERAMYGYPPYSRLVAVMLRHADRETLGAAAARFGDLLRPSFGDRLLGPQPPVTEKIKGEYALLFLLKVPRGNPMSAVRKTIGNAVRTLLADRALRGSSVTVNVDPM